MKNLYKNLDIYNTQNTMVKIDKSKVRKKGYFARKKLAAEQPPPINNETIGMSLEKSICDIFNVDCDIESHRYRDDIVEKMYDSNMVQLLKKNDIVVTTHLGKDNGPIDFEVESNGISKTLSAKTLKKKMVKFAPKADNQHTKGLMKDTV